MIFTFQRQGNQDADRRSTGAERRRRSAENNIKYASRRQDGGRGEKRKIQKEGNEAGKRNRKIEGKAVLLMLVHHTATAYSSGKMDLSYGGSGMGEEDNSNSQTGKKQQHRHSTQQIQQLEAFYKECPHPDKDQREQLSRELGLDQKQIKFWFQNKRTQMKAQNERAGNHALRIENEKIRCENLALQEVLKNVICPSCNGPGLGEEEKHKNLQILRMENARLKEEHERTMNLVSSYMGNSTVTLLGSKSLKNMCGEHYRGEVTPFDHEHMFRNSDIISSNWSSAIQEINKSTIIETAIGAVDELIELFRLNEPVWIKAPPDGRYMLHYDNYCKLFPKSSHFKTASARFESSHDSGEVAMAARHLTEMLLDVDKWTYMFPTIVMKTKTIEVLDTGSLGGSLQLMYEKMHVLSPLVAPREFFFIRYCRQLNSSTWIIVDVSHDFIKEIQDAAPTRCWKLPSGFIIEDMSNGKSKVTWIEHVQVDDKSLTHRLYRDVVCGCEAYGAKRWITSLQRMCERFAFSMGQTGTPERGPRGVIDSLDGRRNLMKLSHKMVMDFCEALSMSHKSNSLQVLELENNGVRVTLRKSDAPIQPDAVIVTAATSLWLPLAKENIFNFLKDEKKRVQWDALFNGDLANVVAHISTGTHCGNCISVIQPISESKENNAFMLQESSFDSLGALMIYAPIELPAIVSVANGEDPMKISLLPSGLVISGDGLAYKRSGASTSSATNNSSGSLLTVAFQISACQSPSTKQLNMESVATLHSLVSSTVQNIKVGLDCPDKD